MGKSKVEVLVDPAAVTQAFTNVDGETGVGLIIGTVGETADFCVAHFAETLEEDTSGGKSDSEEDEGEIEKRRRTNFDDVPPTTLAFHAKQVMRMLPGGLNILGVYIIDPRETIFSFSTEPRVKSMISYVTRGILKSSWHDVGFEDQPEKLFLHYNPRNQKFCARIFDCTTLKAKSVEVVQRNLNWAKLECEFDTIAAMHVPKKDAAAPLKKNLQSLMKTFFESLNETKILINGQFPSPDDVYRELPAAASSAIENKVADLEGEDLGFDIDIALTSKETVPLPGAGDASSCHQSERGVSPVHILFDKEPGILRCETPVDNTGESRSAVEDEFINHLHIQGKIAVVAYVPEGSSTAALAMKIRQDIIRSMASRIEMHCESLIDEESTMEPEQSAFVHHEIPRRVFVQIPNTTVLVSDYLFPGEGPKDSLLSFKDILSIYLDDENAVIVDKEQPFTDEMQVRGSVEELLAQADNEIKSAVDGFGSKKTIFLVLILAAFLLSLALPQLLRFLSPTDPTNKTGEEIPKREL